MWPEREQNIDRSSGTNMKVQGVCNVTLNKYNAIKNHKFSYKERKKEKYEQSNTEF